MIELIKQELQNKKLCIYWKAILMIGIFLFAFIGFIAFVAKAENEVEFLNYRNIVRLTCAISLLLFSVLSVNMSYQLMIKGEVYKKRLLIRMFMIFSIIEIATMLCTGASIGVFFIIESIVSMIPDSITSNLIITSLKTVIMSGFVVYIIGILTIGIAVFIKSLIAVHISAFILYAIYGNYAIRIHHHIPVSIGVSLIMTVFVIIIVVNKINKMEERK